MSRPVVTTLVGIAIALAGCSDKRAGEQSGHGSKAAVDEGTALAAGPTAQLLLDSKPVAEVPIGRLIEPVRITELLPPGSGDESTWTAVKVEGEVTKELTEPGRHYRGQTFALFRGPGDRIALGVFPLVPGDGGARLLARPVFRVANVERVSVARPQAEPSEPATLIIAAGDDEQTLTEQQLLNLEEVGRERQWRILDVVGLAADARKVSAVTVHGEDDLETRFSRAQLRSKTDTPVLRLNRRRKLRVDRLVETQTGGDGSGSQSDAREHIRDARRIVVEIAR